MVQLHCKEDVEKFIDDHTADDKLLFLMWGSTTGDHANSDQIVEEDG